MGWEGWFCFIFFGFVFLAYVQSVLCRVNCVDLANDWISLLEIFNGFTKIQREVASTG